MNKVIIQYAPRLMAQQSWKGFFVSASWIQASACMSVTPAVPYLSTRIAGCSVGPEISRAAHNLTQTPRVIKKNYHSISTNQLLIYLSN